MQQISSRFTFLHKFLIAPGCVLGLLNMWISSTWGADPRMEPSFFYVLSIVLTAWFFWLGWPLKKVSIYGDKLYVSNYRREIAVPLSDIDDVRGNVFTDPQRVTIYLRNETEFGSKIVFLATHRRFSFWSTHPIVDELRYLATKQQSSGFLSPPPRP